MQANRYCAARLGSAVTGACAQHWTSLLVIIATILPGCVSAEDAEASGETVVSPGSVDGGASEAGDAVGGTGSQFSGTGARFGGTGGQAGGAGSQVAGTAGQVAGAAGRVAGAGGEGGAGGEIGGVAGEGGAGGRVGGAGGEGGAGSHVGGSGGQVAGAGGQVGGTGGTGGIVVHPTCPGDAADAYLGTPGVIPGTIEAEDFDSSGYSDSTTGNEGGAYRTGVDVDIKEFGAGYVVGWMTAGEWIEYTVSVPVEGDYDVTLRAAAVDADRTLRLSQCGTSLTGPIAIPQVAAWGELANSTAVPVHLLAGLQVIRVTVGANDYVDFDSMTF